MEINYFELYKKIKKQKKLPHNNGLCNEVKYEKKRLNGDVLVYPEDYKLEFNEIMSPTPEDI